jgi:hypothetical protein
VALGFGSEACQTFLQARSSSLDLPYRHCLTGYLTAVNKLTKDTVLSAILAAPEIVLARRSREGIVAPIRKETIKPHARLRERRDMREKKPIIGTIVGVFDGALDGLRAQLIRRTRLGYTVKLLESRDTFRKGDRVHLSVAEFHIHKGKMKEL